MGRGIGSIASLRWRYAVAAGALVALGAGVWAWPWAPGGLEARINLWGSPLNQPVNGFPMTNREIAVYRSGTHRGDTHKGQPVLTARTSASGRVSLRLPAGTYALGAAPGAGFFSCPPVVVHGWRTTHGFIVCSTP